MFCSEKVLYTKFRTKHTSQALRVKLAQIRNEINIRTRRTSVQIYR